MHLQIGEYSDGAMCGEMIGPLHLVSKRARHQDTDAETGGEELMSDSIFYEPGVMVESHEAHVPPNKSCESYKTESSMESPRVTFPCNFVCSASEVAGNGQVTGVFRPPSRRGKRPVPKEIVDARTSAAVILSRVLDFSSADGWCLPHSSHDASNTGCRMCSKKSSTPTTLSAWLTCWLISS